MARAIGFRAGADDHATEIQGSEGALRVSHVDGLFVGRRGRWEPVLEGPSPLGDALRGEWEAFLAHVGQGGPSPVPAAYGRTVVATVLACVASSERGQVVAIQ